MAMFVLKGPNAIKVFGAMGTWYCPVKQCKLVGTTEEIQILDKSGEISWARLSDNEKGVSITPICPFHGIPLDFHSSTDLVKAFIQHNRDKDTQLPLALPPPKGTISPLSHPYNHLLHL